MDPDVLIDCVYQLIFLISTGWSYVQPLLLFQYPYSKDMALGENSMHIFVYLIVSIAANALNGTLAVYASIGNSLYWVNELILVVICSFGGGFLAPVLLGRPSLVMNNDVIVFCCITWWYLVFYCKGNVWLNYPPVKGIWLCFVGLFRTTAVTNIVTVAATTYSATIYYPSPIFGPVIAGTVLGSAGQFLPFDKGLAAVKNVCPWTMQAAFLTSTFFHFMVNDTKGFIGHGFRSVFGNLSKSTVLSIIAVFQITHLQLQYWIHPDANLFTPFHKMFYLIFQVNGPKTVQKPPVNGIPASAGWDKAARNKVKHLINFLRILFVFIVIIGHIYLYNPPVRVRTENIAALNNLVTVGGSGKLVLTDFQFERFAPHRLLLNSSIGHCQFFGSFRSCQPFVMKFEQVSCGKDLIDGFYGIDNHPFCWNDSSSSQEVFRLALYKSLIARDLIPSGREFEGLDVVQTIPLLSASMFQETESEVRASTSNRAIALSPALHFSEDGRVLLFKPYQLPGQSVTVFYHLIGNMEPMTKDDAADSHYCGVVSPQISEKKSFPGNSIRWVELSSHDGRIVASCNSKNKDEL
jgi:hypothetical protein